VISPDVGEDDVRNKDGGCPVQNEDTKNLKQYQVMKVSFKSHK
jgi:hypothetical protein